MQPFFVYMNFKNYLAYMKIKHTEPINLDLYGWSCDVYANANTLENQICTVWGKSKAQVIVRAKLIIKEFNNE